MTRHHHARLAASALLVAGSFGVLATAALVVPVLALAGLLAALVIAGHR